MPAPPTVHLFKSCFHEVDGKASYDTDCSNNVIAAAQAQAEAAAREAAAAAAEASESATDSESSASDAGEEVAVKEEL